MSAPNTLLRTIMINTLLLLLLLIKYVDFNI